MGVPEVPHRAGDLSPGVLSPPPGQALSCLAPSGCWLCWCLADNPGTAPLVQGGVILAAPPAGICAQLAVPCCPPPACCFPRQVPLRHRQ